MSDNAFVVEQRRGLGWCVVGPDGQLYEYSPSESSARYLVVQRNVTWANDAAGQLQRLPRHDALADWLRVMKRIGWRETCAPVIATCLDWPVAEVVATLLDLQETREIVKIGTCPDCRRPGYAINPSR